MRGSFTAQLPVEITFADGAIAQLPAVLGRHGVTRPFVIVEEPVLAIGQVSGALRAIAPTAADPFVKPSGEPTMAVFEDAVLAFAAARADGIVAIGGGSAIDLARGTRAVVGHGSTCNDTLAGRIEVAPPHVPLVSVPTTAGTGADLTGAFVVRTADGRKRAFGHPLLRGQATIVDSELVRGLPAAPTLHGGVDALSHCIAACMVANASPLSVAIALEGIAAAAEALPRLVRDPADDDARRTMSLASTCGGLAINLADCSAEHALGHGFGGVYELPHGLCVGLVLAECLEVNRAAREQELARIASALGRPGDGVAAVRSFLAEVRFPVCRDLGIDVVDTGRLVAIALDDYCITTNPVAWSADEVRGAFDRALALERR